MKGRETRIFAFGYRLTFKSRDNTANTLVFCKYIIFKSKKKNRLFAVIHQKPIFLHTKCVFYFRLATNNRVYTSDFVIYFA